MYLGTENRFICVPLMELSPCYEGLDKFLVVWIQFTFKKHQQMCFESDTLFERFLGIYHYFQGKTGYSCCFGKFMTSS